jgi:hypothetical protein
MIRYLLLTCIFLWSCNPDKITRIDFETLNFRTTGASQLFFKNVRQIVYRKAANTPAAMDIYRKKGIEKALLKPVMVVNWREDRAHILLEPADSLEELVVFELQAIKQDSIKELYSYEPGPAVEQTRCATWIYNHILSGEEFQLILSDSPVPLFPDNESREAFRITMIDFFRLIEAY